MKLYFLLIIAVLCSFLFDACKGVVKVPDADSSMVTVHLPAVDTSARKTRKSSLPDGPDYVEMKDSAKLVHIKNQFYRNKKGELFERMSAPKDPINPDAGAIEFFRTANQDVDPMTFEVIDDSWFARDKKHVYNYRGNDSGMFCITMDKANVKYFRLMPGDSGGIYGMDNEHVFEENAVIEHIDPLHMKVITGKDGHMVKIISGRYVYTDGEPEAVLIKKK